MNRFCRNCGRPLGEGDRVCGYCGTPWNEAPIPNQTDKSASDRKKAMGLAALAAGLAVAVFAVVVLAVGFVGNPKDAAKRKNDSDHAAETEDGSDQAISLTGENAQQTGERDASDLFVMDREQRRGFMYAGEPMTDVPDGYVGIYSVDDMQKLAENTEGKFILMADLDVSGLAWEDVEFKGTLDGNYHIVSGLKTCLFQCLKGDVRRLGMENVDTKSAALVWEMKCGTIGNCYVTGKIEGRSALVNNIVPISGAPLYIQDCYNMAEINYDDGDSEVGGIVGYVDLSQYYEGEAQIYITNCENYGRITANASAGGIVGGIRRSYMQSETDFNLLKCFNYGAVSATDSAGGMIGYIGAENYNQGLSDQFNIRQCANYGEISGGTEAGGICGDVSLCAKEGYNIYLAVHIGDCLNTAAVNLISSMDNEIKESGGICGEIGLDYGMCSIERCLNIGNTKSEYYSRPTYINASPTYVCEDYYNTDDLSISQMKDIKANLEKFNYPSVWGIDELYDGFPHPYGEDESESVMAYYNAEVDKAVEQALKNAKESDIILKQRYADILAYVSLGGYWPEDEKKENYCSYLRESSENTDNYYAIADVDHDGREELVIKYIYGAVAYNYDLEEEKLEKRDLEEAALMSDELQWTALQLVNYSVYTRIYVQYYLELLKRDKKADIAIMLDEGDDGTGWRIEAEGLMDLLESDCGIAFEEIEEDFYYEGKYDGAEVLSVFMEEGGSLAYHDEQVNDLTLFGVYPGMSEKEAEGELTKYGFRKQKDDLSYATGDASGNYFIHITTENGLVTEISVRKGSSYAG